MPAKLELLDNSWMYDFHPLFDFNPLHKLHDTYEDERNNLIGIEKIGEATVGKKNQNHETRQFVKLQFNSLSV